MAPWRLVPSCRITFTSLYSASIVVITEASNRHSDRGVRSPGHQSTRCQDAWPVHLVCC